MSEASVAGIMEVALKGTSVIDMHQNLHLPPKHTHSAHKCEESCSDDQTISASCAELPKVAHSSYKNCSSPSNLSTTILRCERCDSFETSSRATLLLHVVQCLSSPVKFKPDDIDVENLSLSAASAADQVDKNNITTCGNSNKQQKEHFVSCNNNGSSTHGSSRKVFECDVCNMKFSNGANMRRHKMRHTGVKPYECRVCQKRFFRKDHLAEHFTTHTKTLPYHCPICNRGFQRQIAMRAHFQNEHVGQHDLVKTCPLCSYRAGSMKSLRIHFYNRHGIDLDNPGQGGSSSLLLALESQASQVASAASTNFVSNLSTAVVGTNSIVASTTPSSGNAPNHQSDSAESLRSNENGTPPMHYLTPHVEISMQENSGELFNGNSLTTCPGPELVESKVKDPDTSSPLSGSHTTNICTSPGIAMEQPMDFNTKSVPISSFQMTASPKSSHYDNHIMPSISLIPIKQELNEDLADNGTDEVKNLQNDNSSEPNNANTENNFSTSDSCKLSSLIKVSPLKSLLREDLKRRICAKANNRVIRNSTIPENNNIIQSSSTPSNLSGNSTAICNGTITSTGQETESTILNRKQILACHFCGIEFPDETLYFLHKGCHCESNPWKCNICGEQCNNVYEFNSHLLSKSHQ